ncbi:MAG: hypothetical protein GX111_01880 [Clostridiales bacterium]|nr:hypothetical protein [Clostridiales bacterium]
MHRLLIKQAAELYALGLDILRQQEKVASIYDRGYDIRSGLFIEAYTKLSEMSTHFMQLEIAHIKSKKARLTSVRSGSAKTVVPTGAQNPAIPRTALRKRHTELYQ